MTDGGGDLDRWLAPFLARLGHKARRRMCPLYVAGLIGPGNPQERRADGVAMGARRLRRVASFHGERRLERSAAGRGTRDPGGQADRRRQRSPCRGRHGAAEEGVAFGRGRAAIRLGARQDRQLPNAGVADPGAGRGSGDDRLRLFLPESWTGAPNRIAKARVPRTGGRRGRSRRLRWPRSIASALRAFGLRRCWRMQAMACPRRSAKGSTRAA